MSDPFPEGEDVAAFTRSLKRGSEASWKCLHDAMFGDFERVARSRGVCEDDLPDVLQRFYLRMLKHMKPFERAGDFRAWCFCLLRSEVIDHTRRNQRRGNWMERFRRWIDPSPATYHEEALLEGMDPEERNLLERHYVGGWSQSELAGEAGVSRKAMESKLARLRRKAKAMLENGNHKTP